MCAMKKRRKSSRKKSVKRLSIELLVLCLLLAVAAYLGTRDTRTAKAPSSTSVAQAEKRRAPAVKQEKREPVKAQKAEARPAPKAVAKAQDARPAKAAEQRTAKKQEAPRKEETRKEEARKEEKRTAPAEAAKTYRLLYAADGDSFELADEKDRKLRVRLYGVDAPEGRQKFGKESRANLISMLKGQRVSLKTMYTDNYQRAVAIVYLVRNGRADELSINQRQVQAGMAWVYDYYCTSSICNTWKLEEAMAQKERLGLWKDGDPTPPWLWRRANPRN